MIDSFVWLAPLLLLPIVALVAFVGCDKLFGIDRVPDPLEAPANLEAVPGNKMVSLTWSPVDKATGYVVKRGTVSGDYDSPFPVVSTTAFTDSTVTNGTTYYYVVQAVDGSQEGGTSEEVSATPSAAALISFITQVTTDILANVSGWFGMAVTVGVNPVTVVTLGRIVAPGNSQIHTLKIVDAASGSDVPGAFVSVSLAGKTPGTFEFGVLNPPVTLQAGASYYILSQEIQGTDQFYNHTGSVMTTDVAVLTSAARGGPPYVTDSSVNKPYGFVNFQY
jgi:hypothetical protein